MADKIRLLPEVVANQIAAGEVVNRPASVVKEMMENAIDAGARTVKVNFRDGGKELIQIVDDGCGMSAIDARMAFDRHATSKIRSAEDIYALRTFGFRGEALASIAAVAQVELRTRQAEDELGTEVEIHGGVVVAQRAAACPAGSQFFVRNLFYNVPARRRFLEKSTTSAKQIKTEFQRVALCYPEVAFELYANDAPLYRLAATSLAGRIVDLVGRSIKQNLLDVDASTSIASLRGFIGRPSAARQRNAEQYLFVNGRYFRSPYLASAILRAYEKLIPQSAQPSWFLFFTIDPSRIDVNIHPQKTEVKFADEEAVWQILNAAVRETLAKSGTVPMMDFDSDRNVDIPVLQRGAVYEEPRAVTNEDYNPFRDSYIDPSAPDPNRNFRGFDVPYRDAEAEAQLSDVAGAAAAPGAGAGSGFGPDAGFGPGTVPGAGAASGAGRQQQPADARFGEIRSGDRRFRSDVFRPDESFRIGIEPYAPERSGSGAAGERGLRPDGDADPEELTIPSALSSLTEEPADIVSGMQPGDGAGAAATVASGAPEEESFVDFASPSIDGSQQTLPIAAERPLFSSPVALGSGLLGALSQGRFVVIDIRRAFERLAYERFLTQLRTANPVSQALLFPERLVVSDEEYRLLEEQSVELAALGFDLLFAGDGAVEVRALPADLPASELDTVLYDLLQRFAEPVDTLAVRRERSAAVLAAAAAKSAPRSLTAEEAAALLERLAAAGDYTYSPSGKRILVEFSAEELRAKLG